MGGGQVKDENEIRNARKQSEVGKENMINILKWYGAEKTWGGDGFTDREPQEKNN